MTDKEPDIAQLLNEQREFNFYSLWQRETGIRKRLSLVRENLANLQLRIERADGAANTARGGNFKLVVPELACWIGLFATDSIYWVFGIYFFITFRNDLHHEGNRFALVRDLLSAQKESLQNEEREWAEQLEEAENRSEWLETDIAGWFEHLHNRRWLRERARKNKAEEKGKTGDEEA